MGGISTYDDPQNIKDIELVDARNIIFDNGIISPRPGSEYILAAPIGETGSPTQMLVTSTSDGVDFLIGIWGIHFYLFDETNVQWVLISGSVTPTISGAGVFYGSANWNKGKNNDIFYFCNGTDQFVKWQINIGYLTVATTAASTTLTLDATRFPTGGGNIIIDNGGVLVTASYSAATATSITLTSPIGVIIPIGSIVTTSCVNVSGMKIGNILAKFTGRLFTTGGLNTETTLNFSKSANPEDFTLSADTQTGGSVTIVEGQGGITDLQSFGQFLTVYKRNTTFNFKIIIDDAQNSQIYEVDPLVFGSAMGPFKSYLNIAAENNYYFPTFSEGIFKASPTSTGTIASVDASSVSERVGGIIGDDGFTWLPGRVTVYDRKIIWLGSTLSTDTTNDAALTNDVCIVLDLRRDAWTVWDNWDAVDIKNINGDLYFITKSTGALCRAFPDLYQDFASSSTTIGYSTYALTKRFDLDLPSQVKTFDNALYLQGYIDRGTTLYVDVLYNEKGGLGQQTYAIDGSNQIYVSFPPLVTLGSDDMGIDPLGGTPVANTTPNGNLFRVYLDVSHAFGYNIVQLRFYTELLGSNWGVTLLGLAPVLEGQIPVELVISPAS